MKLLILAIALALLLMGAEAKYSPALEIASGGNIALSGGGKVTGMANGTNPQDAVTVSQMGQIGIYSIGYSSRSRHVLASTSTDAAAAINAQFTAGEHYISFEPGYNYTLSSYVAYPSSGGVIDGIIPCLSQYVTGYTPTQFLVTGTGSSAFTMNYPGCGFRNARIYYPNQSHTTVAGLIAYPATFDINSPDCFVEDVAALNPYTFIDADNCPRSKLRNLYMNAISAGINIDTSADVGDVQNIEIVNYHGMAVSGTNIGNWTNQYGTGMYVGKADGWNFDNVAICGYAYGLRLNNHFGGKFSRFWMEGDINPLYVDNSIRPFFSQFTLAAYSWNPCPSNTLYRDGYAFYLSNTNGSVVSDSEILISATHAFNMASTSSRTYENLFSNLHIFGWALNSTATGRGCWIVGGNNTFSNIQMNGYDDAGAFGIYDGGQGTRITGATIQNTASYGLWVAGTARGGMYQNMKFYSMPLGASIQSGAMKFMMTGCMFDACTTNYTDSSGSVSKLIANNLG